MKTIELTELEVDIIKFWLDTAMGLESDDIEQDMLTVIIEKLEAL